MRINIKNILVRIKFYLKYFYTYFLFKVKPVVYYTSTTLRNCGKTWLVIKTASEYKLSIITSTQLHVQYIKETAKIMKSKGIIKNIPAVYSFNEHLNGFGNIKVVLDDLYFKDYDVLKNEYFNIEIIGGFVYNPNTKTKI